MPKRLIVTFFFALVLLPGRTAASQTPEPPPGPVYIVQDGDTLWDLAILFDVSVADLVSYNSLPDQDIYVGDRLVIPGMEGLEGILDSREISLGETIRGLKRRDPGNLSLLVQINRLVSPTELCAGCDLISLQEEEVLRGDWVAFNTDETFLEFTVRQNTGSWNLLRMNKLDHSSDILPGDALSVLEARSMDSTSGILPDLQLLELTPLPIVQGQTAQIRIKTSLGAEIDGTLSERSLRFFPFDDDFWISLQGIHVMTDPGLYPFSLTITPSAGEPQHFEQMVLIRDGFFRQDPILLVEPSTIDPAITEPENELIFSMIENASPTRFWQGEFLLPVADQFCIRSFYGNRRSYNGSEFIYFHTGVDYGVCSEEHPFDVYAPAAGKVIYTGSLVVRGNATIIDHGWGVYSGLWHQEEVFIAEGDQVTAGQLIGKIGSTGRVTGAHLHWEIWVNGIQANPLQWLEQEFPHE